MKYYATAFAMGVLWFLALYPFASALQLGGPVDLLAMCLASLTVAAAFRQRIAKANRYTFMLLSVLLPCVGAFVFGALLVAFAAVQNIASNGFLPDYDAAFWMLPITCVLYGAIGLCPVSIPMGFLSQYVMHRVSRTCA